MRRSLEELRILGEGTEFINAGRVKRRSMIGHLDNADKVLVFLYFRRMTQLKGAKVELIMEHLKLNHKCISVSIHLLLREKKIKFIRYLNSGYSSNVDNSWILDDGYEYWF